MSPRFQSILKILCRLMVLAVFVVSLQHVRHTKSPSKSIWAKHVAQGKEPSFKEHLQAGFWYGAAGRVGACGALLLVSVGWGLQRKQGTVPPSFNLGRGDDAVISPRAFKIVLGVIFFATLIMRLPRMSHCFWGDETAAIETYVHGRYNPLVEGELNGPLVFDRPTWTDTFWRARQGPNNHQLFSSTSRLCLEVWRKLTGRPDTDYAEWVARIPVLVSGMGSLIALALLMKKWGAPRIGLLATAVLALHPWHIRYSTEARGYGLMLLLFPLLLLALTYAMESNRWKHWAVFGLLEFLIMFAWSGIAYGVAGVNVAAALLMLWRSDRWPMLVRWATANLVAAALFISVYAPQIPQIMRAHDRLNTMKGFPMDEVWFHNLLSSPFTGIPFHGEDPENSEEMSWEHLLLISPVITTLGFAILVLTSAVGLVSLWRRNRPVAALITGVFAATVVCAFHFYFGIKDELRPWYLVFNIPWLSICVAMGMVTVSERLPQRFQAVSGAALFAMAVISLWPMNFSLMTRPEEDFRGAVEVSRGKHETFSPDIPSKVITCWLWRFSDLYDPRGYTYTRDAKALRSKIELANSTQSELYVIVGYPSLSRKLNVDMLVMLENPALFEKYPPFWAREAWRSLIVYRMKR